MKFRTRPTADLERSAVKSSRDQLPTLYRCSQLPTFRYWESVYTKAAGSWEFPVPALDHSTAAEQPHEEEHDGDDQQDPDEVAQRVTADHPQQPEDDQDDRNGFEHVPTLPFRPQVRARASERRGCNMSAAGSRLNGSITAVLLLTAIAGRGEPAFAQQHTLVF